MGCSAAPAFEGPSALIAASCLVSDYEFFQIAQKDPPMKRLLGACALLSLLAGCASHDIDPRGYDQTGTASYYGARHHGKRTASGEPFDQHGLTAAHRQLPFGTRVLVTNLSNNKSVVVRINDRGPHTRGRLIDLSRQAAEQLGMLRSGTAKVRVQGMND